MIQNIKNNDTNTLLTKYVNVYKRKRLLKKCKLLHM